MNFDTHLWFKIHKQQVYITLTILILLLISLINEILGEAVKFSLSVQPAMNYPLDLYLLMDLSFSMSDDLLNVQALASDIGTYLML